MQFFSRLVVAASALLFAFTGTVRAQSTNPVVVFLVRHAETVSGPKRILSAVGRQRAAALASTLAGAGVSHLFSSEYVRTRTTLGPLAERVNLDVTEISARQRGAQVQALRALPPGSVAVVAGHSNTVPQLIEALGARIQGFEAGQSLPETIHDRLFSVTLLPGNKARLMELRYGAPSAAPAPAKSASSKSAPAKSTSSKSISAKPTSRPSAAAVPRVGFSSGVRRNQSLVLYSRSKPQQGQPQLVVHGRVEVTYGSPTWKSDHDAILAGAPSGTRLRLGKDFFTTFDTSRLMICGGTRIPAGQYYLCLEKTGPTRMQLVFLDPNQVRRQRLQASDTSRTKGGLTVPLQWTRAGTTAEELKIELGAAGPAPNAFLVIQFGGHRLTAALSPEMAQPPRAGVTPVRGAAPQRLGAEDQALKIRR